MGGFAGVLALTSLVSGSDVQFYLKFPGVENHVVH